MRIVCAESPARVALAGNPSDGYGGKVLSLAIANYRARAIVYEWPRLEIVPAPEDGVRFNSVAGLVEDVESNGYYGGLRLVKASVRGLAEHLREKTPIDDRSFSIRYETTIPRGVGLGGSSAIVIATLRAICEFCEVEVPLNQLPALALAVETGELGIAAGPQDRVAQSYGGLTFMDFSRPEHDYEPLDPETLPQLYVAHLTAAAEPSDRFHAALRRRSAASAPGIGPAIADLAASAERARAAVLAGDGDALAAELAVTYAARRRLGPLDPDHVRLIEIATAAGTAANFTGSGGAVVGRYRDDAQLADLQAAYAGAGCTVVRAAAAAAAAPGGLRDGGAAQS